MPGTENELAVIILAGGEGRRLPGKLESDAGGEPLILRVYHNLASTGPVYLSCARSFSPEIDAALHCPMVIDRQPHRGPLGGLFSTLAFVREPRVFAVAGDAPFIDASVARELQAHWEPGVQAVVPVNTRGILEPLCAIYDRTALLAACAEVSHAGSGSVASAVERLAAKRVRLSGEHAFVNVNTPSDRQRFLQGLN